MEKLTQISSKDNKIIKYISKLQKSSKFRYSEKRIVAEGLRIAKDLHENDVFIDILVLSNSFYAKFKNECDSFVLKADKSYLVSDFLFEKICDTETPQGIIIVADMPDVSSKIDKELKYIALDNLQDPSNLGAIARTCEALSVGGIILNSTSCDPFSPKSIRASMGTLLRMSVFITDDLSGFFEDNKLRSFACVVDKDALNISEVEFSSGDVLIIGNEANGISDKVKNAAFGKITIPMSGKAESLNAAAAAAIAIYELTK